MGGVDIVSFLYKYWYAGSAPFLTLSDCQRFMGERLKRI